MSASLLVISCVIVLSIANNSKISFNTFLFDIALFIGPKTSVDGAGTPGLVVMGGTRVPKFVGRIPGL